MIPSKKDKGTILEVKQSTSKRNTLSQYTKRTLGSGNMRAAVALPENGMLLLNPCYSII